MPGLINYVVVLLPEGLGRSSSAGSCSNCFLAEGHVQADAGACPTEAALAQAIATEQTLLIRCRSPAQAGAPGPFRPCAQSLAT